jgi:hydroxymethylbilane synthase
MKLRLGTRGSDLALTQSRSIAAALLAHGVEAELVIISTSGDRSTAPSFGAIGPQGVFVREIEEAMLAREIDCAVHSYKDLPTHSPPGLVVAAVPERQDVADWLLYRVNHGTDSASDGNDSSLLPLRTGARIGTSSARRQAWLRHYRPDCALAPLRGNVPTRIRRLAEGGYDAIVLAGAGIDRLNAASNVLAASLAGLSRLRLDPERFVPAPAQGALAVQCREDDSGIREALAALDLPATRAAVTLERAALALAEGGCDTAFGAHAKTAGNGFALNIMIERGGRILSATYASASASAPAADRTDGAAGLQGVAEDCARRAFAALRPVAEGAD